MQFDYKETQPEPDCPKQEATKKFNLGSLDTSFGFSVCQSTSDYVYL